MRPRSLGYQTHLIYPRFDGSITEHDDYSVIRTPKNPGFWWGNFVLFKAAPKGSSYKAWKSIFEGEFGPERLTLGWDAPERGEVEPFLEAGCHLNETAVLVTDRTSPPPHPTSDFEIRPLDSDREWQQAIDLQVLCREGWFEEESYRTFRSAQMARYRAMQVAGRGAWFGAFVDGQLVADLGVFTEGELARFQAVETHPDFRRRGICGTMVHVAGEYARSLGAKQLVMLAEEEGPRRVYESVGFRYRETEYGIERR